MKIIFFLVLQISVITNIKADYSRLLFHEVLNLSELIVLGEIKVVDSLYFYVNIKETLKGKTESYSIKIRKFENWSCASRWGKYKVHQKGIFALNRKKGNWQITGFGNEGEMPIENENLFFITTFGLKGGYTYKKYSALKFNLTDAKEGIKKYLEIEEELEKMITNKTLLSYYSKNEVLKKIKIELIGKAFSALNLNYEERAKWLKLYSEK